MPIPTQFSDLADTAAGNSNYPAGTENPKEGDNHLRQVYAFLRQLSDEKAALADLAGTGAGQGAALVGFIQRGASAVAQTLDDVAKRAVSVMDYIPRSEHAAIYAGVSAYDAFADIMTAMEDHSAILLPDQQLLISGAVGWTSRNDVALIGSGPRSKLKRTTTGAVVQFTTCSRPVAAMLATEGNYTFVSGGAGIAMTGCADILIAKTWNTRSSRQGISVNACEGGTLIANHAWDNWQDGIMIRETGGVASKRIAVVGNYCHDNGDPTFESPPGTPVPIGEGIHLFNAEACTVVGNVCYSNTDHGLAAEGAENCVINGNTLTHNAVSGASFNSGAVLGGDGSRFTQNIVTNNGSHGVVATDIDDLSIDDNTCRANGGWGILVGIDSEKTQNRITTNRNRTRGNGLGGVCHDWNNVDNEIKDNQSTGNTGPGILVNRSGSVDTVITGNKSKGNTGAQITDNGTTSRVRGNDVGNKLSGSVALVAGTATVTLSVAEPSSQFLVSASVPVNETIRVTGHSTTGFTLTSSNAASTTTVRWAIVDSKVA